MILPFNSSCQKRQRRRSSWYSSTSKLYAHTSPQTTPSFRLMSCFLNLGEGEAGGGNVNMFAPNNEKKKKSLFIILCSSDPTQPTPATAGARNLLFSSILCILGTAVGYIYIYSSVPSNSRAHGDKGGGYPRSLEGYHIYPLHLEPSRKRGCYKGTRHPPHSGLRRDTW